MQIFDKQLSPRALLPGQRLSPKPRILRRHYQAISTSTFQVSIATPPYRHASGIMFAAVSRSVGAQTSVQTSISMHEVFEIAKSLV